MGCNEMGWLTLVPARSGIGLSMNRLMLRRSGQSTVEYALVGALVVIGAAGAMALLGEQISSVFGHITTTLSGAPAGH